MRLATRGCAALRAICLAADALGCHHSVGRVCRCGVSVHLGVVVVPRRLGSPISASVASAAAARLLLAARLAVIKHSVITILVSALVSSAGCTGGQTRFGSSRVQASGCVAAAASHRASWTGCHGAVPPPHDHRSGWASAVLRLFCMPCARPHSESPWPLLWGVHVWPIAPRTPTAFQWCGCPTGGTCGDLATLGRSLACMMFKALECGRLPCGGRNGGGCWRARLRRYLHCSAVRTWVPWPLTGTVGIWLDAFGHGSEIEFMMVYAAGC